MKITEISQQQKRKDRVSIYVDGTYRVSLSQDQFLEAGLRTGQEVDEADIQRLLQLSEVGKALAGAYNYLSYRPRSQHEVVRYLRGKKCDSSIIDEAISRLQEQKLVDDAKFARDWIENRQLTSPRSKLRLKVELREKGLAPETIDLALESLSPSDEIQAISQLIEGKRLRQRYPDDQKLIAYLAHQGFAYDTIKQALEAIP